MRISTFKKGMALFMTLENCTKQQAFNRMKDEAYKEKQGFSFSLESLEKRIKAKLQDTKGLNNS
jgi:hypothetical protein